MKSSSYLVSPPVNGLRGHLEWRSHSTSHNRVLFYLFHILAREN